MSASSSKKQLQEKRRLLDNNFPIPPLAKDLPSIHLQNGILAIKYMIGLYTATEVKKVCEEIQEQKAPYNIP
jgi:hypothetical protein